MFRKKGTLSGSNKISKERRILRILFVVFLCPGFILPLRHFFFHQIVLIISGSL